MYKDVWEQWKRTNTYKSHIMYNTYLKFFFLILSSRPSTLILPFIHNFVKFWSIPISVTVSKWKWHFDITLTFIHGFGRPSIQGSLNLLNKDFQSTLSVFNNATHFNIICMDTFFIVCLICISAKKDNTMRFRRILPKDLENVSLSKR